MWGCDTEPEGAVLRQGGEHVRRNDDHRAGIGRICVPSCVVS